MCKSRLLRSKTETLRFCRILFDRVRETRMRGSFVTDLRHAFIAIKDAVKEVLSKPANSISTDGRTQQFLRECAAEKVVSTRRRGDNEWLYIRSSSRWWRGSKRQVRSIARKDTPAGMKHWMNSSTPNISGSSRSTSILIWGRDSMSGVARRWLIGDVHFECNRVNIPAHVSGYSNGWRGSLILVEDQRQTYREAEHGITLGTDSERENFDSVSLESMSKGSSMQTFDSLTRQREVWTQASVRWNKSKRIRARAWNPNIICRGNPFVNSTWNQWTVYLQNP